MPDFKYQSGIALPLIIIIAAVAGIISTLIFTQSIKNIQNIPSQTPTPIPTLTPKINTSTENPAEPSAEASKEAKTVSDKLSPEKVMVKDAPPDESVFQEVATQTPPPAINVIDTQPKEMDNRSDSQRQQDLNLRDQSRLREGIASNIIDQNLRTFDFREINFPLSTPQPSSTSSLYKTLSRIRLFNSNPSPPPSLAPTPKPTSGAKWAIVVILDWVLIHDDKDPVSNGEVQIIAGAKTADIEQHSATPYVNWYEANNGSRVKVNRPIFVAPKDKIGDKLALWFTAVDNDSLPDGADNLLKKATKIFDGLGILYDSVRGASSGMLPGIHPVDSFLSWLGGEEHIGTLTKVLSKSDNFGLQNRQLVQSFEERSGDATFHYSVWQLPIPQKPFKVDITLKKIAGGETGDWDYLGGDGDLYVRTLVSDGFAGGSELNAQTNRIPSDGYHGLADHHDWNIDKNIFSHATTSPIIFYEVGVWDKDDGSNDDELAVASGYYFTGLTGLTTLLTGTSTNTIIHGRNGSFQADEGLDANADVEVEANFTPVDSL